MVGFLRKLFGGARRVTPVFRQGDVLVIGIEAPPPGAIKTDRQGRRIVLAWGEVTGHAHAVADLHVEAFERDGQMFLRVPDEPATLRHEEHDPIELPPGAYEVRRQREYVPAVRPRWVED